MDGKTVRVAYRVTPERSRELRQTALDQELKIQELIDNAVDALLNQPTKSTERTAEKFTPVRHKLVHNYPIEEWMRWAEMILVSDRQTPVEGLASNMCGFLSLLMGNADIEADGIADATSSNAPDYTAEVARAQVALEQLRSYFKARRKRVRSTPPKTKT